MSRMRPDETTTRTRKGPTTTGPEATISLLPIGADLLPRQASTGRGGRSTRWIAAGVVLLAVVAVAGAFLWSLGAKSDAEAALASAQDQQRTLQVKQKSFGDLVTTKQQVTALHDTLANVMKTDAPWSTVLAGVAAAGATINFTSIDGTLADPKAAVSTTSSAAVTTPGAIGALTINGTAADKPTIASFVEALAATDGFADPFLSSVTATNSGTAGYTFTVTVALTGDLRSAATSRWATTTGGGK